MNIWARKPVEDLCADAESGGKAAALPRTLGVFALTCIGVGATVGAGIFVLTGSVAAGHSGPAVGLSFLLASLVCLLAALCYAELAAMIPVAGSAYSYTYATLGEAVAWTVGWCLMMEYLFSASLVAISWAGYAQSTLHQVLGVELLAVLMSAPFDVKDGWRPYATGTLFNLPAMLVTVGCTLVLLRGLKTSTYFNNVMVVSKIIAILVLIAVGLRYVDPARWVPYVPANTGSFGVYGLSGVFQGTAILVFAYIGFDAVSTMGQETRNPQRVIPLSLLLGLAICAVLYLVVSFVVTGMVPYKELDVPDPMYLALDRAGPQVAWAKLLVGFVAVVGLVSVLLVTLMGQVRIFYAMSRDGLLPAAFARVHESTRVPHVGTWVTGVVSTIAAGLLPLGLLGDIISMGTLLAFSIVCGGLLVLRRTRADLPRPFRAPGGAWLPLAGVVCCVGLMTTLPRIAMWGFLAWLLTGAVVYLAYGAHRSKLRSGRRG